MRIDENKPMNTLDLFDIRDNLTRLNESELCQILPEQMVSEEISELAERGLLSTDEESPASSYRKERLINKEDLLADSYKARDYKWVYELSKKHNRESLQSYNFSFHTIRNLHIAPGSLDEFVCILSITC